MKKTIIRAESRGHFNFGWLDTWHTFSFGEYHNRERMHFGALRVINDDFIVAGGKFPSHPHNNMEIITIVLSGRVENQDSLGNKEYIKAGEIQAMSAGSGIIHSEANPSSEEALSLFQIWIYPREQNLTPRYATRNFISQLEVLKNQWQLLVSPVQNREQLMINQDAYLSLGEFDDNTISHSYQLNSTTNSLFIMVVEGSLDVENELLESRDAIMLSDIEQLIFKTTTRTRILAIEVPMLFR
jgi:hypothetical protein